MLHGSKFVAPLEGMEIRLTTKSVRNTEGAEVIYQGKKAGVFYEYDSRGKQPYLLVKQKYFPISKQQYWPVKEKQKYFPMSKKKTGRPRKW